MATLKISDLSVGDWVRCRGRNGRIECLDAIRGDERIRVAVESYLGTMYQFVGIEDIEPIPITAEILGENGKSDEWSTWDWEEMPSTEVSPSRQCMRVRDLGTHIFLGDKVVYVHQLQHVLRIAGVDKEINL